uniref:Uncharacterized protein n=1 Tax=Candidatus Kentrum sp. FW TaxID=2126338 RepID=A0A450TR47_9GAMM|nr:MAG: hypothetical protein BECKFW1821C_GA0114237_10244 [Candidatus Kentron sp. FW]
MRFLNEKNQTHLQNRAGNRQISGCSAGAPLQSSHAASRGNERQIFDLLIVVSALCYNYVSVLIGIYKSMLIINEAVPQTDKAE